MFSNPCTVSPHPLGDLQLDLGLELGHAGELLDSIHQAVQPRHELDQQGSERGQGERRGALKCLHPGEEEVGRHS